MAEKWVALRAGLVVYTDGYSDSNHPVPLSQIVIDGLSQNGHAFLTEGRVLSEFSQLLDAGPMGGEILGAGCLKIIKTSGIRGIPCGFKQFRTLKFRLTGPPEPD